VRYDTDNYPRHSYGRVEDQVDQSAERDERVVSRRPWVDDSRPAADEGAERAADAERRVYYRRGSDPQP
jgi:hypothetical protein